MASAQPIREQRGNTNSQANNEQREIDRLTRNEHPREMNPQNRNEHRHKFYPHDRNKHHHQFNPQNRNDQGNFRRPEIKEIAVNGTLKLEKGFVAIQTADDDKSVFIVPMLNRYIGFIIGLQEGAAVSIEGFRFRNFIQPKKLTIDSRTYDFPVIGQNQNFGNFHDRRMNNQRQSLEQKKNN